MCSYNVFLNKYNLHKNFCPSSGAQTTVSTASGICHTVTAICCYRGRVGTGLSVLWVVYIPDAVDTVVCMPDDG
jgi:hypothetical protein